MNTHPLPVRVAMPPAAVPGLIETNSRTMFASPSSRVLASPAYLRSCGIDPTLATDKMRVSGHDRPPEPGALDRKQPQRVGLVDQVRAELDERLADEHAGQNRRAGKMAREVRLVGRHELRPDGPRPGLDLEHPVDQRVRK